MISPEAAVAIVGGTGALGFALALLAREGVAITTASLPPARRAGSRTESHEA